MSINITDLCNISSLDPRCDCINPPVTIKNLSTNMLSPYYCWYAPCLSSSTFKTQEILQGQQHCQVTNCSITVEEIRVRGGNIRIENNCSNNIEINDINNDSNIDLIPTKFEVKLPVFAIPTMLLLFGVTAMSLTMIE